MIGRLVRALFGKRLQAIAGKRAPDFTIGGADRPYLLRWFLIPRNPVFNVYLHEFRRDDDDRALHDHPWFNCSILIEGRYVEHTIRAGGVNRRLERKPGDLVLRSPWAAHRIELKAWPCLSLFITGPRLRAWGFHCPTRWVHWREFTDPVDSGAVGRGCGEP